MEPGIPFHMLMNVYWVDATMYTTAAIAPVIFPCASANFWKITLNWPATPEMIENNPWNRLETLKENSDVCFTHGRGK